jgi:hypothetical protein
VANPQARRRLRAGVIARVGVVALSLVIIYAPRPATTRVACSNRQHTGAWLLITARMPRRYRLERLTEGGFSPPQAAGFQPRR